jgi:hypothetical protein
MGAFNITLVDYDGEPSTTSLPVPTLTAANFDAQGVLATAFRNALGAFVLGDVQSYEQKNNFDVAGVVKSENEYAQRELKWKVEFHETVSGLPHYCTIGTAAPLLLDPNNRKVAHMGDGLVVDAFVTAFQDYVRWAGVLAVTVDRIVMVGRNV